MIRKFTDEKLKNTWNVGLIGEGGTISARRFEYNQSADRAR